MPKLWCVLNAMIHSEGKRRRFFSLPVLRLCTYHDWRKGALLASRHYSSFRIEAALQRIYISSCYPKYPKLQQERDSEVSDSLRESCDAWHRLFINTIKLLHITTRFNSPTPRFFIIAHQLFRRTTQYAVSRIDHIPDTRRPLLCCNNRIKATLHFWIGHICFGQ